MSTGQTYVKHIISILAGSGDADINNLQVARGRLVQDALDQAPAVLAPQVHLVVDVVRLVQRTRRVLCLIDVGQALAIRKVDRSRQPKRCGNGCKQDRKHQRGVLSLG